MDCTAFGVLCRENACIDSGGNYTGVDCVEGPEFDFRYYENATAECWLMEQRCIETGLPREGSCWLPSLALLLVAGFASRSFK